MRYVTRHTAITRFDVSGVRVRRDERVVQRCRQIDVGASDDRDECFHKGLFLRETVGDADGVLEVSLFCQVNHLFFLFHVHVALIAVVEAVVEIK